MSTETPRIRLYLEDAQAVDELFRQALAERGPKAFADFMEFTRRFKRYSIFNTLLVQVQRPGAKLVASRTQWRSIGRSVLADAVPIIILQPFGPIEFVYEQRDTNGKPLPGQDEDPFLALGRVKPTTWRRTTLAANKCGVVVEVVHNYGSNRAGTATVLHGNPDDAVTLLEDGGPARFRVRINGRLDEAAQLATLTHELGHIFCGHLGADPKGRWPPRAGTLTHSQQELEAEAVAWLVCRRAGIEPRSARYLSFHVEEGDLAWVSVYAIASAAHRIEARGESEPPPVARPVSPVLGPD